VGEVQAHHAGCVIRARLLARSGTTLVLLALTSNNWSVRQLGAKRWKLLHRLAYVAGAILIYHQTIAGKGHWYIAAGFSFLSWRCKVRG